MFDRWLALWSDAPSDLLPEEAGRAMRARAAVIAESLKLASFFHPPSAAAPAKA
jgi:hypothetical protein